MRYRPAKSVPGVNRSAAGGGGGAGRYAPVASGSGWSGIGNSSIALTISARQAGPLNCSTRVCLKVASRIQVARSAPVQSNPPCVSIGQIDHEGTTEILSSHR
jgi:hypothetical protein